MKILHALKLDPTDIYALNNLGATLYALGRHKEAVDVFDEAIHLSPDGMKDFGHNLIGNNKAKAMSMTEGVPYSELTLLER